MKRQQTDVAIVGAGIIGCSIARELALRGVDVSVFERDSPGRSATWAAAGMLSPLGEADGEGPFLDLADESLRRFPNFVRAVRQESGLDIEYRTTGKLHVSLGDADDELSALAAAPVASRFDVTALARDDVLSLEPSVSAAVTSAVLVGRDHCVNNRSLAQALTAAATAAGVTFRKARPVTGVMSRSGAIAGIRLANGEEVHAANVVIAAGAWSGELAGLPRTLPVRPVRGQMFAVHGAPAPGHARGAALERVVQTRSCYIIPREDGRLLVGATVEDVGFDTGPTPRGIAGLMTAATDVIPRIADMPLVETWAGFRPATPDRLPVLGPDPDLSGLFYATGHFRNGILLSPVTAAYIAELIAEGSSSIDASAFGVARLAVA